jgi:DnaA family protein
MPAARVNGQLPLRITLPDSASLANFYPGSNGPALRSLQRAIGTRAEPFIYLWGGPGIGKTHLLQAASREASEQGEAAAYLPLGYEELAPDVLEGMEGFTVVTVDDIHVRAGQPAWETALFHLYNRLRDAGACLLMAGRFPPERLGIALADLVSRLSWGPVFELKGLSDEERLTALQHRARGRGLELPEEVGWFLLKRYPRDMSTLFGLLDTLDKASLEAKRRLTLPFVKSVLNGERVPGRGQRE